MNREDLTAQKVWELLEYNPRTGVFRWRNRPKDPGLVRDIAGYKHKQLGYRYIQIEKVEYAAHRLAWLYYFGRWPAGLIDHINRVRHDNRIANLRESDLLLNGQNTVGRGVTWRTDKSKWWARICVDGQQKNLGFFDSEAQALDKYAAAKLQLHGVDLAAD